jgi:hypothetical protein
VLELPQLKSILVQSIANRLHSLTTILPRFITRHQAVTQADLQGAELGLASWLQVRSGC